MQTTNHIGNVNVYSKILKRKRNLAKSLPQVEIPKRRMASRSKTLGFMILLGLSALSIPAMANNRTNVSQTTQTETEFRSNEFNQRICDFYSKNKKSIWGSAIGLSFLMFHLVGRHKIYSMEVDCPDNFFEPAGISRYPFVNEIYFRRRESYLKRVYANYDNRNMIQKATDFLIDKGIHFTWSKGWTYTPIRKPKPVDPIKEMLTWELKNKLCLIRMDIGDAKRANEQHTKDYGHDNWLITKKIETLQEEEAKIKDELRSRGEM